MSASLTSSSLQRLINAANKDIARMALGLIQIKPQAQHLELTIRHGPLHGIYVRIHLGSKHYFI